MLVYHCARLIPEEIAAIEADGLKPLSENLLREKIHRAVALGYLQRDQGEQLLRDSMHEEDQFSGPPSRNGSNKPTPARASSAAATNARTTLPNGYMNRLAPHERAYFQPLGPAPRYGLGKSP